MSKLQEIMIQRTYENDKEWDCGEIYPNIYLGSLQAALDETNIRKYNIRGILTVANQLKVEVPEGIQYLQINIADHPCSNILEIIDQSLEFIDSIILNDDRILVHCASGVSRSASVCCAWLMIRKNLSFEESIELVRQNRPRANPNLGFRQQLNFLEKHHNILPAALHEYNSVYGEINILDVIRQQRDEVNRIHTEVDSIENALKLSTEPSQSQLGYWKSSLISLMSGLELITQQHAQKTLVDPPSVSIRKSATSKIIRLLEDIESLLQTF